MLGTPDEGRTAFGRGLSGILGTPDEGLVTLGRGDSGIDGTPLANEIA
jgi:hypothetical protein